MSKKGRITLIVLGDIGRSPRMQYHCQSFAESNFNVNIIGYGGSKPMKTLVDNSNIITMQPVPEVSKLPRLCQYVFKTLWQTFTLLIALVFKQSRPNIVMVQNPPAIPTIFACWCYCFVFRSKLVIDWHNYAHSIMALTLPEDHRMVKFARWMESYFGRKAVANFCVTRAMQTDLLQRWNIKAYVLYDRPPEIFRPISLQEKHEFISALSKIYTQFQSEDEGTVFTKVSSTGNISLKENRPGMIVSSTSWTDDEDFSILFSGLKVYQENVELRNLPDLICVITGKGPLKEFYCDKIRQENWKNIKIITPWLKHEDYPLMLASADIGVSLHTSSSGLDLPMKVVDMFGCNLPVCAYDFKCLHELVKNDQNSFTFKDTKELSEQLMKWFEDFPNNSSQKKLNEQFKMELQKFSNFRWRDNWNINVLPVINDLINK